MELHAENVQDKSPDQASEYAVRRVDRARPDPAAAAKPARWDDRDLHRRHYRDPSTGFGYMGGQGGRYV